MQMCLNVNAGATQFFNDDDDDDDGGGSEVVMLGAVLVALMADVCPSCFQFTQE